MRVLAELLLAVTSERKKQEKLERDHRPGGLAVMVTRDDTQMSRQRCREMVISSQPRLGFRYLRMCVQECSARAWFLES